MARREEPRIPGAVLDRLLAGAEAKTAFGRGGSPDGPKGTLAERALNAGMGRRPAGDGGETTAARAW